jgi:hypothetical protein
MTSSSSEAQARLDAVARELPEREAHFEVLTSLETRFRTRLHAIDAHTSDPGEQREHDSLKITLRQLENGVRSTEGIWFPDALAPVMDRPGIAETRRAIERLQREREECNALLQRWPTREVMHKFRYNGPRHKHVHDGRRLEVGDIIELTESQAHAWCDRFEPVSDGMPVTT